MEKKEKVIQNKKNKNKNKTNQNHLAMMKKFVKKIKKKQMSLK